MSRLTDTLQELREMDLPIGAQLDTLEDEFATLSKRLPFGLNFERHKPEYVEMWGHPVRKGAEVRILHPRGSDNSRDNTIWTVAAITDGYADVLGKDGVTEMTVEINNLVAVTMFGSDVFPGLEVTGEVCREGGGVSVLAMR